MPIRLSGMNSGLDTDAIVKELVSAYNLKTQKYQKAQTKLEWKQDAWKSLNTKIYSLYTNISNLRYSTAYNLKRTTVSDSTKAKVTASSGAVVGTQTLSVKQMAQSCYLTGAKLSRTGDKETITSGTNLTDLGCAEGSEIQIQDSKGNLIKWKVTKPSTPEAGDSTPEVETPSTEEVNSSQEGEISVIEETPEQEGETEVGDSVTEEENPIPEVQPSTPEEVFTITTVSDFVNALKQAGLNASFDEGNQRFFISSKESGEGGNFTFLASAPDGTDNNDALEKLGLYTYENEIEDILNKYDLKDFEAVKTEYNTLLKQKQELTEGTQFENEDKLKELEDIIIKNENSAIKIDGSDAEIVLNGATYTSSSNTFSINGLTIEAMGKTDSDISITTATDTQGIYDKIKDFLTEYNNIINEMTKLYNADSAKNYEPLTSEEKEAMTEEEVEKWEEKIKDALLRRDTTLNSVMSAMTNSMAQSIVVGGEPMIVDGKTQKDSDGNVIYKEGSGTTFSLSSFGIQTLGFLNAAKNEQNAYHIDGDEDDANTSGKTDKLMKAIQENADQVCEFMQRLATKLYSAVDKKMKSSSLSSAYKVYNDKEMDKQLKDYKDTISKWEEKVSEKEEYYYKKFSAMETALSKLQNQTNSLAGLIGGM